MLRPATEEDRDLVLPWRNAPEVRAASITQHVISPDEHARWWSGAIADPSRRILIYERSGMPSGVVTFFDLELGDPEKASGWWGFYLDGAGLEQRGELLLAWLEIEREAIRYAFGELGLQLLEGEVLASNEAVRAMNRRHRFREVETYERVVDDVAVEVVRVELRAQDARR